MGGKASILLVLGFSLIFLVLGHNFGNISNRSVENLDSYFTNTMAHNLAVSGANMAANEIFMDKTWSTGYSNVQFNGGTINVTVSDIGNMKEITSVGAYRGYEGTIQKTVKILFQPSNFARFGNFYDSLGARPCTGDTFSGPFHTQAKLKTNGAPVFWGKVTCRRGLLMQGSPQDPKFYGGFESGVNIPRELDTMNMRMKASVNGKVFKSPVGNSAIDVEITFNADGTVTSRFKQKGIGHSWSPEITEPLNTLAPNGLIYVEKGTVYLKGTLNGQATIVASKKNGSGCGNIIQVDDIVYHDNPLTNPASTDMLGLIAEKSIIIQYNDDTKHHDIYTQASMFALEGNIGPDQALIDNDGYLASWHILGGLVAGNTKATAKYGMSGGITVPVQGYRFVQKFDERFLTMNPPEFPDTRQFEIVSWYE